MPKTLYEACRGNDFKLAKNLLEGGADPNEIFDGVPLLIHILTDYDIYEIGSPMEWVRLLVEHGADPNLHDDCYATPLFWAVHHDLDMVKYLIEHGAEPNYNPDPDDFILSIALDHANSDRLSDPNTHYGKMAGKIEDYLMGLGAKIINPEYKKA
jgi:ankyrin repeat protein